MPKKFLLITAVVLVVGIAGFFMARTISQQQETQRRLDQLQQDLTAKTSGNAPVTSAPAVIIGATTQGTSLVDSQRAIRDVTSEGYRLLNTRDPANVEKAVQIFKEGLEKVDPKNTDFLHGLGRAYLVLKRYPDAVQAFNDGLAINPKKADLSSGLGWAYYNQKDFFHAKQAWETALANDPRSIDAWSVMAWVYLGLAQRDKSIEGFIVLVNAPEGAKRTDWKNGLTMARASNYQLNQIRSQFPLPDPSLFTTPATTKP